MAETALLDLLNHLTWQPPALVGPAPAAMGSGGGAAAYEAFLSENEAEAMSWRERGQALKASLWSSITSGDEDLTVDGLTEMIDKYEKSLRREARIVYKMTKLAARDVKEAPLAQKALVRHLNDRRLAIGRGFYEYSKEFALFLRAARAELDPNARGGPTFDNPDDLERFLLSAAV